MTLILRDQLDNTFESWCLVLLSSFACITGALVVFIDRWHKNEFLTKGPFLSASMSLGSGVLVYSSIAFLLPASIIKLQDSAYLSYIYFLTGAIATSSMTFIIHWFLPTAIHTCDHNNDNNNNNNNNNNITSLSIKEHEHHHHHHHHHHNDKHQYQQQPYSILIDDDHNTLVDILKSPLIDHLHSHQDHHHYGSLKTTTSSSSSSTSSTTIDNSNDHHDNLSDFYQMGIQTAIALCIHKFPEGLIMFISNETSTELGVSIGLAICIHNLIEGAMIALPIYYATKSRTMAFLYAAILGGASQPIGALIGLFLIDSIYEDDYLFGILFAIVSGMMLYIAIQSMLPQAMKADQRYVTSFFFIGIFIVGLVSLFNAE
ncbi:unnamed protein product [Cunninghamella echinulata]